MHILPLLVGIVGIVIATLTLMLLTNASDDAIASSGAAALGILGNHFAPVSGHALGHMARSDGERSSSEQEASGSRKLKTGPKP